MTKKNQVIEHRISNIEIHVNWLKKLNWLVLAAIVLNLVLQLIKGYMS